jgi:Flp pilus assembly protein TadD
MRQLRSAPVPAAAASLLLVAVACGGHTFDERLAEARRLRTSGGAAEAAAILADLSRGRPGDASLMYEQAQALHDAGKDDEALDRLTAALQAKPDLTDARVLRGVVLGVLGRDQEALADLRQVAATQPDRPGVHRAMGIIHARANRFGPAVNQFEKELARNPADAETLTDLGLFYLQTGQIEQAADRLQRAATAPEAPARAHRYYAEILFKQGRREEGLEEQRKAISLAPRDVDLIISHARALQGYAHADEAPVVLHAAIDRGVTSPRLYVELARQEREALNYDAAVAWLQKAIALDDSLADAHIDLGKIYLFQGRREEARAAFERAQTAAPTDAYAPFYLATLLMEDGKYAEAEPLLKRSIELDPLNPKAHYSLGQALQRLGRDDEARSELALHAEILKRLRESKQTAGPATTAD